MVYTSASEISLME